MKRLFIATHIRASAELKNIFLDMQKKLTQEKIKWVEIENLHLTLKFLGDTPENKIPEIRQTLYDIVSNQNAFEIKIEGLGVFPSYQRPRVLWLGVTDNGKLKNLAEKINIQLEKYGFDTENKPFKAHLTLGRIKFLRDTNKLRQFLNENNNTFVQKQKIKSVILFESILRPQGPIYKIIEEFNLKN